MDVTIIKYNAGNIYSVDNALRRLGITPTITDDASLITKSDRVIFPGVGEAETTMSFLREKQLDLLIKSLKQPVLGICLGMQLMCNYSEEGNATCLGIFDVDVMRFKPDDSMQKIPHMGWNNINATDDSLFHRLENNPYVYFVHSYYVPVNSYTAAITDYIHPFSAALHKDNFYATQFHPEKSGAVGEKILQNFLDLSK